MPELEDVRHAHPIADLAACDRGYADADLAERLAEIVYRLRTTVGLTQTELARRTGTTQVAIARLGGGGSTPTLDLLDRVGRAVGAEIMLIVNGVVLHLGASAA
jgi:ribosome-binding protein aMBF1 (putative translation factor)